jgi:hypothetical protein
MKNITLLVLLFVLTFSFSCTASAYNFGTTTLKNGSRGEAVMELQRFLNSTLNLGLVVDGKLGPKTVAILKKWQNDHGLKADGLIGPKTKQIMNSSVTSSKVTKNTESVKEESGACLNPAIKTYVSPNTPKSIEIKPGQKNVDMAHYKFEGEGTITKLDFNLNMDTGDAQTNPNIILIPTLRLYDENGNQIASTNFDIKNGYIFSNSSLIILKNNQPRTISVKADIGANVKNRQQVSVGLDGCKSNFTDLKTNINKKGFRIYDADQDRIGLGNSMTILGENSTLNLINNQTMIVN